MLRSTSIKNDSWKPIKLIARQTVSGNIVDISCSRGENIVVVLSDSHLNIFTNRNLTESIELVEGRKVIVSNNNLDIFVLTHKELICFDFWGKIKWSFSDMSSDSLVALSDDTNVIYAKKNNTIKAINFFGTVIDEFVFESDISDFQTCRGESLLVSTQDGVFVIDSKKNIKKINNNLKSASIYCALDYFLAVSDEMFSSYSYTGSELWREDTVHISNVFLLDYGTNQFFLEDSKKIRYQDRNRKENWVYISEDELSGLYALESGLMFCFFSKDIFHVIDEKGQPAWSYSAREKIIGFYVSKCGGEIIIYTSTKVHWFENEGFLRISVSNKVKRSKILLNEVSVYEDNLLQIKYDIDESHSLQRGNFKSMKRSFQLISSVFNRLISLKNRHSDYLDAVPAFMENLGLKDIHTDEMLTLLYPYYSMHNELSDFSHLSNTVQTAKNSLLRLEKQVINNKLSSSNHRHDESNFLDSAKIGIQKEIKNIDNLISSRNKDIVSFESDLRELILSWLKNGISNSKPFKSFQDIQKCEKIRSKKQELIVENIENHLAFVNFSSLPESLVMVSFGFKCDEFVNLALSIQNDFDEIIEDIIIRVRIEGKGLSLASPELGVERLSMLKPKESFLASFDLIPINRELTKISMVLQYLDESRRRHTNWLCSIESNFLGCYIKPFEMSEGSHAEYRMEYKDFATSSSLNIEGLPISTITDISKKIEGMFVCNSKEEGRRSVIYHSAQSSLDESLYLSMFFLRSIGNIESMRTVLELVCHSDDLEKSSELKREIISAIKNKVLKLNGRLV